MRKKLFLPDYVKICDLHAERLKDALENVQKTLPFTAEKFENMSTAQVMPLDMAVFRFSQL